MMTGVQAGPTANSRKLGRYAATLVLSGSLVLGCSSSALEDLPDSISHEPSGDAPTQKNSTTYEPIDVVESNEPSSSNESGEPSQADSD